MIVTHDADFLRLHEEGIGHAGIVYAARSQSVGSLIRRLVLISHVLDAAEMEGHVEFA